MQINHKKNRHPRMKLFNIMLLFALCLTIHAFFCGAPNQIETRTISESAVASEGGDCPAYSSSDTETLTENPRPLPAIPAISKGSHLLFFFPTSSVSLPDRRTLMNQKVRLDN